MEKNDFHRQHIPAHKLPGTVVSKWSASVLDEGYVPFPKRLLRCLPALFKGEKAMAELAAVLAVVDFRRPNLSRDPSVEYLAFLSGLKVSEFDDALASLENQGYVTVSGDRDQLRVSIDGLMDRIMEVSAKEAPF